MILIDSNIPMYLAGAAHPHKSDAQRTLERLVTERQRLITDAEVLQEILHRYMPVNRREAIQPAFDALPGIVDEVLPIEHAVAERATQIVLSYRPLSARDGVHVAASTPASTGFPGSNACFRPLTTAVCAGPGGFSNAAGAFLSDDKTAGSGEQQDREKPFSFKPERGVADGFHR